MASIEELVRQDRYREAIEQLTAENRVTPETARECQLAELRLDSFQQMTWPEVKDTERVNGTWPPVIPDVFRETPNGTIPEISAKNLNADTLAAGIFHHGAIIVRGLVDPQQAETLARDIDTVLEAQRKHFAGGPGSASKDTSPWFAPPPSLKEHKLGVGRKFIAETGGIWAIDSPRALFRVIELYEKLGIKNLLADFFGEAPCLSVRKWVLRRVAPIAGESDWHQDGSFMGKGVRSCNLWIALNTCGGDTDTPGIELIPKRLDHIVHTGSHGARFEWVVGPDAIAEFFPGLEPIRPLFEAGDAVFFDHFNLHRTAWAPHHRHARYAIECWFFAPSSYPKEQIALTF